MWRARPNDTKSLFFNNIMLTINRKDSYSTPEMEVLEMHVVECILAESQADLEDYNPQEWAW